MPEENNNNKRIRQYIKYAMIAFAAVLLVLIVFLILNYRSIRRSAIVSARESWITVFIHNHGPLAATDVGYVRSWMTFDYINKLFNLPPDYLKMQLMISDSRYPQLTVSKYAGSNHLNLTTFLGKLENALRSYLTAAATSTTP